MESPINKSGVDNSNSSTTLSTYTTQKKKNGPAVFGYSWENGCLVINESEAYIRKLMFDFFLKTKRKKTTATMLNNLGYRTRAGKLFSHTTVNRLLQDTTAKGCYPEKQEILNRNTVEQQSFRYLPCISIVSEDIWNACQVFLTTPAVQRPHGPQTVYLLSGYLYCSCGRSMYVYHRNKYPAFRCRTCKTKIMVDDIDAIYREQLHPFLLTVDNKISQRSNAAMLKNGRNLYEAWEQIPFAAKRSIIEVITQKIILFTNTIDIRFLEKITAHAPINVGKSEHVFLSA